MCASLPILPKQRPKKIMVKGHIKKKTGGGGSSHHGTEETNPTRNHEVVGLILGLTHWVKDLVLPWPVINCRRSGNESD